MTSKATNQGSVPTSIWDKSMTSKVADLMESLIRKRAFSKGDDINDSGFKPKKNTKGKSSQPLVDTGLMENSLTVLSVGPDTAEIGVSGRALEYAAHTQKDRPWMGLSPQDLKAVDAKVSALVDDKVGKGAK